MRNPLATSISAASDWPPIARFVRAEAALADVAATRGPIALAAYEFVRFGVKQAWACLFGALLLAAIVATRLWWPHGAALHRYDALFLFALGLQALLLATRMELLDEALAILVFHFVGTAMELFKTSVGSWVYPEPSLIRIGGVPLFTGFMYASIGSYLARAWRLFDFRFTRHPPLAATMLLSGAVYANFYTHHFMVDLRLALIAAAAVLFGPTVVHFRIWKRHRTMPLLLAFVLVALFIWLAENIGTGMNVWRYPSQAARWAPVPVTKLEAWFLLMIVSYTLVSLVERPRRPDAADAAGAAATLPLTAAPSKPAA